MGSGRGRPGRARRSLQGQTRAQNSCCEEWRPFPRNPRLPPRRGFGRAARFLNRGNTRRHRTDFRLGTRPALGRNHQQHQQADRRRRLASRQCAGGDPPAPSLGRGRFLRRRTRARQKRSPKSPRLYPGCAGHGRGELKMATASVTKKARNQMAGKLPPKAATAGRFGVYGGRYVPETLMAALDELEREYEKAKRDRKFQHRLDLLLKTYAGRPTPLFFARRLTAKLGGAQIYLKREDLLHTGAHKINNCLGQGLLVERMGKHRVIAETGAGQHGVATATVCALLGFECVVYMGTEDMRRQELNVFRMRLLGAEVRGVDSGSRTLKDAINEAMRDWVTNVRTTHYLLGSVLGAHPYPTMVRDFHRVIGREARAQILKAEGKLPEAIIACVGGGSNSIGIFYDFLNDKKVQLIGVEAGGRGEKLGDHAARFRGGSPGATPTKTSTAVPSTSTFTASATSTNSPLPPTFTFTPVPPTATNTSAPPTATNTAAPPTSTPTAVPSATSTNTAVPATATDTSAPPTSTNTAVPPTATGTPAPPTATNTPAPPTMTHTPVPTS